MRSDCIKRKGFKKGKDHTFPFFLSQKKRHANLERTLTYERQNSKMKMTGKVKDFPAKSGFFAFHAVGTVR